MNNIKIFNNVFPFIQLLVSGAVVGLYIAKLIGVAGINVTATIDEAGALIGVISIILLKLKHLL